MVKAVISENAAGRVEGFCISGHAGYAEPGSDIICSAVSAVMYTALGYIEEAVFERNGSHVSFEEADGYVKWERTSLTEILGEQPDPGFDVRLDAVLKAMVIGLTQIRESYGKKYLRIQFEEVRFPNVED